MANIYDGWQGSLLYGLETTAGTLVATTLPFGIVKNLNNDTSANLEEEGAIGTPYPVQLDENLEEVGGSCEFLPVAKESLLLAKRDGSGLLNSYSIHSAAGPGIDQVGCKVNNLRITLDAGGRLRSSLDWFSLASLDASAEAAVIPTDETLNWIKCTTNLSAEVAGLEIAIAQNLRRVPVVANASTTYPVSGQHRAPYKIKEGRQAAITLSARFFERPSENVIDDVLTEIATMTLRCTGVVGGSPVDFVITLSNGKPNRRSLNASDNGEALWPVEFKYKTWDVDDYVAP